MTCKNWDCKLWRHQLITSLLGSTFSRNSMRVNHKWPVTDSDNLLPHRRCTHDIVQFAIAHLPSRCRLRFLEPGFGTGAFYSAMRSIVEGNRIEVAAGYELDPYYGCPAAELWNNTGLKLTMEDFTIVDPPLDSSERFNLVVCNPPHVRHHHLKRHQKSVLRRIVERNIGIEMNGLSGLYAYFMILSRPWMSDNAIGAWLIPSEFMDVNYGRQVKEFLLRHVKLLRVHRFDPSQSQFDDALVSSAIVVFQNCQPNERHKVEFSYGGSICEPAQCHVITARELMLVQKWSHISSQKPPAPKRNRGRSLRDLFLIKRGLATGDNNYFILDSDIIERLNLPRQFFIPILPSPRYLESDTVTADENGDPQISRKRYLLACDLPEEHVRKSYPSLWDYFQHGASSGVKDRYLCQHRQPWYAQERRPAVPILCSYMGRTVVNRRSPFRFIRNHSNATAPNVYLMLYPRSGIQRIFDAHPEAIDLTWSELNGIGCDSLTRQGRVYGGGLHKMEPSELGNVCADGVIEKLSRFSRLISHTQRCLFSECNSESAPAL